MISAIREAMPRTAKKRCSATPPSSIAPRSRRTSGTWAEATARVFSQRTAGICGHRAASRSETVTNRAARPMRSARSTGRRVAAEKNEVSSSAAGVLAPARGAA
jgi:hypothetical protein